MKNNLLVLSARQWIGCRVIPQLKIGSNTMDSTPAFITEVTPLKTGKNILRVKMIPILYPGEWRELSINLQIVHHRKDHMVAVTSGFGEGEKTVILETMDMAWLEAHAKPVHKLFIPAWIAKNAESVLTYRFGETAEAILHTVCPSDFNDAPRLTPLPEQREPFHINREFSTFESNLISKGFASGDDNDKTLIYRQGDKLLFHRKSTGHCIYEVHMTERDGRLHLVGGYANRDPEQTEKQESSIDEVVQQVRKDIEYYLLKDFDAALAISEPAEFEEEEDFEDLWDEQDAFLAAQTVLLAGISFMENGCGGMRILPYVAKSGLYWRCEFHVAGEPQRIFYRYSTSSKYRFLKEFGDLRDLQGISPVELAEEIDRLAQDYSKYEAGQSELPEDYRRWLEKLKDAIVYEKYIPEAFHEMTEDFSVWRLHPFGLDKSERQIPAPPGYVVP